MQIHWNITSADSFRYFRTHDRVFYIYVFFISLCTLWLRDMSLRDASLRDVTNSIIFPIWPWYFIRPHISTFKLGSYNCCSWKLLAVINMTCQNIASCAVLAMRLGIYQTKLRPIIMEDAITVLRFTTNLPRKSRNLSSHAIYPAIYIKEWIILGK